MASGRSRIELLQGTLDFIILQTLRWEPQHGFGLAQMIRAHSSNTLQVGTGSLYPALHRLERAKLIEAKWDRSGKGQRVRVYRLTADGRKRLAAERTKWERMTQAIAGILNPPIVEGKL
jgi:PadR family transcriptional regulator PadR